MKLMNGLFLSVAALMAVLVVPTTAEAIDGRYQVTASSVYARPRPGSYTMGRLYTGNTMDIQYVDSNNWAYGYAFGYVNRCVWAQWSSAAGGNFGARIGNRVNGCRTTNMYLDNSEFIADSGTAIWGSESDGQYHRLARQSSFWDNWDWAGNWGNHNYRGELYPGAEVMLRYRTRGGGGMMVRLYGQSDWVFINYYSVF
jgi:hypothetical protein